MSEQWEEFGALIVREVQRQVDAKLERIVLGMTARVATEAVLGVPPVRTTTTGPNGDLITEAAVWIGIPTGQETADNAVWCAVTRGVTVAEGDQVRVMRTSSGTRDWWVDAKL